MQDAHYQRDFHADDDASDEDEGVEQAAEGRGGEAKGDEERQRGEAADNAHQQFDFDKAGERVFVFDVAGEVRADTHRE